MEVVETLTWDNFECGEWLKLEIDHVWGQSKASLKNTECLR